MLPTLDDVLPEPHHRERHRRWVPAAPEVVWERLWTLTMTDLRVTATLFRVRSLPARLSGRAQRTARGSGREGALLDRLPIPVQVRHRPVGVVLAGVGQPWKVRGGARAPVLDLEHFVAFREPGWMKMAMDVRLEPVRGGTEVSTETRVRATDKSTRRRFRIYWGVVRAGSGLVRRDLLRALAVAT
jgi:hypothetical protein